MNLLVYALCHYLVLAAFISDVIEANPNPLISVFISTTLSFLLLSFKLIIA